MNIVQVLDWFLSLNKTDRPVTVDVNGNAYAVKTDGTLGDVVRPVIPLAPVATPTLELSSLTGLITAFTVGVDGFSGKFAVHVESFDKVSLVSLEADQWGRRHVWARATSREVCPFKFGEYMEPELFLIQAQAAFFPLEGNYTNMLKLCSNLKAGSTVELADDGFSQKVVVNSGGVTHGEVELPPRMGLRAYRTFREITPVESDFLLRFKAKKEALPEVALIPVDANRWKTDTCEQIFGYLKDRLPDGTTIIA